MRTVSTHICLSALAKWCGPRGQFQLAPGTIGVAIGIDRTDCCWTILAGVEDGPRVFDSGPIELVHRRVTDARRRIERERQAAAALRAVSKGKR